MLGANLQLFQPAVSPPLHGGIGVTQHDLKTFDQALASAKLRPDERRICARTAIV
jgi:hypothetical protein